MIATNSSNNYSATIDITTRCNLHCKHCRTEAVNYDLSLEQIDLIAQKLAHPKRRVIFISGGEPLTREDIVDIVVTLKKYVPCVCINTNSLLLSEKLLAQLEAVGLNYIQVSLDGLKHSHDYIRGDGTFDKTIKKLHMIARSSIKLHVSCCVSKLNMGDMEKLADFLIDREHLNIDILGYKRFIPKNEMAGKYNLGKDGLKLMLENVELIQKKYEGRTTIATDFPQKNIYQNARALAVMEKYHLSCAGCSAAVGGPCVRADGTVSPCSLLYVISGNLLIQSLEEIYASNVYQNLCKRNLKGKCGTCEYRLTCGGCRAAAYAIMGDYLAEDPECFI